VLKLAGLVLLVALILVGALMPLKYTARMHLPKKPSRARVRDGRLVPPQDAASRDD